MNKNRFVLPIAALLMVPCFIGCSSDDVYQASFNNDQIICTHEEQVVDISLTGKTKNMLHFQDKLETYMFEMPEEYKAKKIEYVASYDKGKSAFILFDGDVNLPEGETSTSIDIKVKKNAFKEKALDSTLSVSLFANQIRYAGYSNEIWGGTETEPGSYTYDGTVEVIGALFNVGILNEKVDITSGVAPESNTIAIHNGDALLAEDGHIELYCIEGNTYYIHLEMKGGVKRNDNVRILFGNNSTSLGNGYTCTFTPDGHDKSGPFIFAKEN